MLIEQVPCSTCAQGAGNAAVEAGVLRRLSEAFPEVTFEVRNMESSALLVLRGGARPPAAAGQATAEEGAVPRSTPVRVGTQVRVLSSTTGPNGSTVAEIEYVFGENLEQLAHSVPAGTTIPSRIVIRVTQNAEGAITAVESLTNQPQALVEALARQTLPAASG